MRVLEYFATAIVFSVLFPGALLFVRTRVRDNRQRLIEEMGLLFFRDRDTALVAFDYVRAKYEMPTAAEKTTGHVTRRATSSLSLIGAALPYILLCALGFVMLFLPIDYLLDNTNYYGLLDRKFFWMLNAPQSSDARIQLIQVASIYCAAFIGGYIMTARSLLRAVQNYELSQLAFLQVAAYLGAGILIAMVLYDCFRPLGHSEIPFGLAFVCGYVPDFGLITLFRKLRITFFKARDQDAVRLASIMPLEILDGIDYDIRYRLEQSGYYDVQNLAVANPLLIYVETPYSLYEAFDWVLQAQLCLAVGSAHFRDLKKHGVRTSLDLERAVLADEAPEEFILSVGHILYGEARFTTSATQAAFIADDVRHGVMVMLDDLHIHRLRKLWTYIFDQISHPGETYWLYRTAPGLAKQTPQAPKPEPEPPKSRKGLPLDLPATPKSAAKNGG